MLAPVKLKENFAKKKYLGTCGSVSNLIYYFASFPPFFLLFEENSLRKNLPNNK